jgi:hypothetical protein
VVFAALVLLILAALYVPAAINPHKYRLIAWLSVLARPPGVLFFFVLYPGVYPLFGIIDAVLSLLQISLLLLTFYGREKPPSPLRAARIDDDWKAQPPGEYRGTSFAELRRVIWCDPYSKLPYQLGLGPLKFVTFFNHSSRNLSDRRDLLPYFDKLIHANGICLTGTWEITEDSPYTGYFAKGKKGLLLVRASVAGLTVSAGTRRALGFGGKLFPTMEPEEQQYPANFVVVSHLSGIRSKHITTIDMTNMPTRGFDPLANFVSRVVFRLLDTRPDWRQLHPISTLGLSPGDRVCTPDLMLMRLSANMPKIAAKDFRDELRVRNYPAGRLVYDILVRNFGEASWNRLGTMSFTEDVVSESGDKRLHFWIPRDRPSVGR